MTKIMSSPPMYSRQLSLQKEEKKKCVSVVGGTAINFVTDFNAMTIDYQYAET